MSKGLEALKYIKEDYCNKCGGNCNSCTIKAIEKELNALEILAKFIDPQFAFGNYEITEKERNLLIETLSKK